MKRLVEASEDTLGNGCVLRLPGQWPHEAVVDLLLVSAPDEVSEFCLVVATGHKAGLVLVRLPRECECADARGVRHAWLVAHWSTWVYPACEVGEVWLLRRYPAPALPG